MKSQFVNSKIRHYTKRKSNVESKKELHNQPKYIQPQAYDQEDVHIYSKNYDVMEKENSTPNYFQGQSTSYLNA